MKLSLFLCRKQKAEQEVKILSALKHRFIVEFHHTDQAHDTFLIFMECMEGVRIVLQSPTAVSPTLDVFND